MKAILFITIVLTSLFTALPGYSADDSLPEITNDRVIWAAPAVMGENKAFALGITDDANKFIKVVRTTPDGYPITSARPTGDAYVNVSTATDTDICQAGCYLLRVVIGVGDASTSVALYDDADGTCSSNLITTLDTATAGVVGVGLKTSTGLCMTSTGHDTGNVTVIYK